MGKVMLRESGLKLDGTPPYNLPDHLDQDFLERLLSSPPGDELFIGELAQHFTPYDKERLRAVCRSIGGALYRRYAREASCWAAVLNPDNQWHPEDFTLVYEAEVNTAWAYRVLITTSNIRFVRTPRGLFSFPEFNYNYGIDIVTHLRNWQKKVEDHLNDVARHISADLIKRKLTVSTPEGEIARIEYPVLATLPRNQWRVPDGYTVLDCD